ncbi:MAG: hypothetical protein ACLFVI_08730 [Archaeoglobaceae archaeon]
MNADTSPLSSFFLSLQTVLQSPENIGAHRSAYAEELYEWGKNRVIEVENRKAVEYLGMVIDRVRRRLLH